HVASLDSAHRVLLGAKPCRPRPLRAARPELRSLEPAAIARTGSALAAVPRLAGGLRAGGLRPRRGHRNGRGRDRARPAARLPRRVWRPLWELYVRVGLPVSGAVISHGWREVGSFLGPSIRELHDRLPIAKQVALWRQAGLDDVRVRRLSLGGGYVVWGRRA